MENFPIFSSSQSGLRQEKEHTQNKKNLFLRNSVIVITYSQYVLFL